MQKTGVMDRSRLPVALALALAVFSIVLALVRIGRGVQSSSFQVRSSSFLEAGRSGIGRVRIHGVIRSGRGGGGDVGAERVVSLLREAEASSSIRGVFLDINSPGGEPAPTKQIFEAVRELKKKKPVIAIIGDVAASGGYYVAASADRIFALDMSVIGSIGVISLHPNVAGLLDKLGIRMTTLKAGQFKDSSYPFREMTGEETQMYRELLDDSYQAFLSDVAEGRKQSRKTVEDWAEGRIFSGKKAKALQLVDDIGGEREAMQAMKLMLKTDDDLPVYEPEPELLEELLGRFSGRGLRMPSSQVLYMMPSADGMARLLRLDALRVFE